MFDAPPTVRASGRPQGPYGLLMHTSHWSRHGSGRRSPQRAIVTIEPAGSHYGEGVTSRIMRTSVPPGASRPDRRRKELRMGLIATSAPTHKPNFIAS
jgi:hypothetical protein